MALPIIPDLDRDAHCRRVAEHLENKYGLSGYLKIWLPWGETLSVWANYMP